MMDYDYDISPEDEDFYPDFYPDNYALADDDKSSPWSTNDELPPMSVYQLYHSCVYPTINDGVNHILKSLAWCIIYRVTVRTVSIPQPLVHMMSFICGTSVMYHFFGNYMLYMLFQGVVAYLVLLLCSTFKRQMFGWACTFACISFLLTCELFVVDAVHWHMIRAAQMLVAMRAISIGFQMDENIITQLPQPVIFFGYLYNVGTVIFGPWIPFKDYLNIQYNNYSVLKWIGCLMRAFLLSLVFLSISACWTHWMIPSGSSKWFLAYRDALSFRSSHYFISFLSELCSVSAGFDTSATAKEWAVVVTRPLNIELPRSLVEVVIHWNVPMHTWLKTYVFRVIRPYGTFMAIFGTYVVSAMLHGLNFQLAAVLLSLGFYTYTEHITRQKLSSVFSACIQARKCSSSCGHLWNENNWFIRAINFGFSLLAMFHLAYLGLMFDSSKMQDEGYSIYHALAKWRWLNYSSHWIMLSTLLFNYLI